MPITIIDDKRCKVCNKKLTEHYSNLLAISYEKVADKLKRRIVCQENN